MISFMAPFGVSRTFMDFLLGLFTTHSVLVVTGREVIAGAVVGAVVGAEGEVAAGAVGGAAAAPRAASAMRTLKPSNILLNTRSRHSRSPSSAVAVASRDS